MPDFSNVLLCSDFDHTFTTLRDEIHPKNIEAVEYFMAHGGHFSIASGRSVPLFLGPSVRVPSNAPSILFNGAACYDYPTKTLLYSTPLPDGSDRLMAELLARFPDRRIEIQTVELHYLYGEDEKRDAFLRSNGADFVRVTELPALPWIKIAVYDAHRGTKQPSAELAAQEEAMYQTICTLAEDLVGGQLTVVRSMFGIVELFSNQCSKGGAARWLANRLGCSVLAGAGDAPNDISMLSEADYGFRTGDCEPQLKAYPFYETLPCGEGALAGVIAQLERLLP